LAGRSGYEGRWSEEKEEEERGPQAAQSRPGRRYSLPLLSSLLPDCFLRVRALPAGEHTPLVHAGGGRSVPNGEWSMSLILALSSLTAANLALQVRSISYLVLIFAHAAIPFPAVHSRLTGAYPRAHAHQATRFLLNFLYMEEGSAPDNAAASDPHVNIALDLGITPTQFGLLSGPLLLMVAVVASMILGTVADDVRVGPCVVVVGGMLVQGVCMCTQALVPDVATLFVVRFFFSAGQGAVTAPALAIIAKIVPETQRPSANSIFNTGVYLGSGLAAAGGVAALQVGWRMTSVIFGVVCLVASAAVYLTVSLPASKGHATSGGDAEGQLLEAIKVKCAAMWAGLKFWGTSWSHVGLVVAGSTRYFAGFAQASFLPVFLESKFEDKALMLTCYGIITALAGVASSVLGGYITQLALPRSPAAAAWVAGIGSLLAAPMSVLLIFYSPSLKWAMIFFFCKVLVGECWGAPALSIAQSMVPASLAATGLASYMAFLTSVGTLGPLSVGALHELGGQLDTLLLCSVTCPFAIAGLIFLALAIANPDGFDPPQTFRV